MTTRLSLLARLLTAACSPATERRRADAALVQRGYSFVQPNKGGMP